MQQQVLVVINSCGVFVAVFFAAAIPNCSTNTATATEQSNSKDHFSHFFTLFSVSVVEAEDVFYFVSVVEVVAAAGVEVGVVEVVEVVQFETQKDYSKRYF